MLKTIRSKPDWQDRSMNGGGAVRTNVEDAGETPALPGGSNVELPDGTCEPVTFELVNIF